MYQLLFSESLALLEMLFTTTEVAQLKRTVEVFDTVLSTSNSLLSSIKMESEHKTVSATAFVTETTFALNSQYERATGTRPFTTTELETWLQTLFSSEQFLAVRNNYAALTPFIYNELLSLFANCIKIHTSQLNSVLEFSLTDDEIDNFNRNAMGEGSMWSEDGSAIIGFVMSIFKSKTSQERLENAFNALIQLPLSQKSLALGQYIYDNPDMVQQSYFWAQLLNIRNISAVNTAPIICAPSRMGLYINTSYAPVPTDHVVTEVRSITASPIIIPPNVELSGKDDHESQRLDSLATAARNKLVRSVLRQLGNKLTGRPSSMDFDESGTEYLDMAAAPKRKNR